MAVVEIIAAIRDEEKSLPQFIERVRALPLPANVSLRMTFIEDSSTDGTLAVLRDHAARDPEIGYYSLEQGFGQGPAIMFGLSRSQADAAIMMDADGSHPPEAIPEMVALHLSGAHVVQCVRRKLANRPAYRRLGASLFQGLASWLAQVNLAEQNIYYRLVAPEIADQLVSQPRYWRFLRFPLPRQPGQLAFVSVDMEARMYDQSKYGPLRLAGLAIDAVLSLMTQRRAWIGFAVITALGVAVSTSTVWPIALPIVATALWLPYRYRALRSAGLANRMRIRESANVLSGESPSA